MTLPQLPPIPNEAVDKHNPAHRRRLLDHLTKAAVEKACKLHVESRRLVHIVDTQSCGVSKGLGISNPFSAMMKKSLMPSPSQPPSRRWAFSKESFERRTVTAKIHSLLLEWKTDSSSDWQARVASAVPVLEEALYKGAKSKEDYTNPQLLEYQLIYVLCHFEAGNGPFLLQGSSPLYSARACSVGRIVSLLHPTSLRRDFSRNQENSELVSERTRQKRRLSSALSSSCVSPNVQVEARLGNSECNDTTNENQQGHASNGFVQKVANMLAKKTRDHVHVVCSMHELGVASTGLEQPQNAVDEGPGRINASNDTGDAVSSCDEDSRRRHGKKTLGGLLQFDMSEDPITLDAARIEVEASIAPSEGNQRSANSEVSPLLLNASPSPSNTVTETCTNSEVSRKVNHGASVDGAASCNVPEAKISTRLVSPLPEYNDKPTNNNLSVIAGAAKRHSETHESISTSDKDADCEQKSMHSPLSPLASAFRTGLREFASMAPSLSTAPSLPLSRLQPPLGIVPFASTSALQEQRGHHQTQSESQQLLSSTGLSVRCIEHHQSLTHMSGDASCPADMYVEQVESQQPGLLIASSRRADVDGPQSVNLSPSTSSQATSSGKKRGVKLPLRRFLADREDYKGYNASEHADKGCPWETWEEATEQLDGMCCVCMVGLKGAAFIPCGHTFCRRCSRELWKGRGTCPLCNRYIREILDIF